MPGRTRVAQLPYLGRTSNGATQVTVALPAPTITAVSPTSGGAGITITGTNLGGTTGVTIGGVHVPFTVNPAGTAITVSVPAGTTSGPVVVTTAGGSATSTTPFSASADTSSSPQRCGHGGIFALALMLSCAAWRAVGIGAHLSRTATG